MSRARFCVRFGLAFCPYFQAYFARSGPDVGNCFPARKTISDIETGSRDARAPERLITNKSQAVLLNETRTMYAPIVSRSGASKWFFFPW